MIDPKQERCSYPFPGICGGVVAYKLMTALAERTGSAELKDVLEELTPGDFVAEIDLSSREILPGQFSTGVNIYAPNKSMVWVSGDYSVIIHVVEKEQNR